MQQRYGESLAERAFRIYDTKGEKAMIAFLLENRDQVQAGTASTFRLQDNSSVQKEREGRTYLDPETGDTRERTPSMHIPLPLRPAVPMLSEPNSDTVLEKLMERVAWEARGEISYRIEHGESSGEKPCQSDSAYAEMMNLYEVITAAPSVGQAVRRGMELRNEEAFTGDVLDMLDEYTKEYARLALYKFLPIRQKATLVQAMIRTIEEDSGTPRQPVESPNDGTSFEIEIESVPGPETRYIGRVLPQDRTAEVQARGKTIEEVRSTLETRIRQAIEQGERETDSRPGTWRETINVDAQTLDPPAGEA